MNRSLSLCHKVETLQRSPLVRSVRFKRKPIFGLKKFGLMQCTRQRHQHSCILLVIATQKPAVAQLLQQQIQQRAIQQQVQQQFQQQQQKIQNGQPQGTGMWNNVLSLI